MQISNLIINNELHQQFITDLFDICFVISQFHLNQSNDPYKITSEIKIGIIKLPSSKFEACEHSPV